MNDVSTQQRYTITAQEALEALQAEFQTVIDGVLRQGHTNGDVNVNITLSARADTPQEVKCQVYMRHYHYGKYAPNTEAHGVEWDEVLTELNRLLRRDNSLKRLTHVTE